MLRNLVQSYQVNNNKRLANNYLKFDRWTKRFAQQYLPELYEAEVERYGNRTLSGFLRMVGAEMPMTSDQVIWSEQNRLHIAYNNCTSAGGAGNNYRFLLTAAGMLTNGCKRNFSNNDSCNGSNLVVKQNVLLMNF